MGTAFMSQLNTHYYFVSAAVAVYSSHRRVDKISLMILQSAAQYATSFHKVNRPHFKFFLCILDTSFDVF